MISTSYQQYLKLYSTGNYCGFNDAYLRKQVLNDDTDFLAVKVFQEMQEWQLAKNTLKNLQRSKSDISRTKASLSLDCLEFVLEHQSRSFAKKIMDECDELMLNTPESELFYFASASKIRIQAALVTLGLANADLKHNLIKQGSMLIEKYFRLDPQGAIGLLGLLMNHSLVAPISDPTLVLKLFDQYHPLVQAHDQPLALSWLYLIKAEAVLKVHYSKRNLVEINQLPEAIEEIKTLLREAQHVCGSELLSALYGSHLLKLDYKEGTAWIEKNLPKLWEFGQVKAVLGHKQQALAWANDRAQVDLKNYLTPHFNQYKAPEIASFNQDLEKLHFSHQHFSQGDFDAGRKVLEEHMEVMKSETNKVHFISLMVNSRDRIAFDKTDIIKIIVSQIRELEHLEKSILLAQLYNFQAIVQKSRSSVSFKKAIDQFKQLGMHEEVIDQLINHFLEEVVQRSMAKLAPIVTQEMSDWIQLAEELLTNQQWLKYPLNSRANLYQTLGKTFFYAEQSEDAMTHLEKAHSDFSEAGNLYGIAMNANYLVLTLIKLGRQNGDLKHYDHAIKLVEEALPIFEGSDLTDFAWRMQFHMALCFSEPIQHGLIEEGELISLRSEKAREYYCKTIDTFNLISRKNSNLPPAERLLAVSHLNKSTRQLVFSGFYFFLLKNDWRSCIEWLEMNRARSLTLAISKGISFQGESDSQLLKEEQRLLKKINDSISIGSQRNLENELSLLYDQMLFKPELAAYALKKKGRTVDYERAMTQIKNEEKTLSGKKLFFLYYYTHLRDIYAFGIGTGNMEPLVKKIPISVEALEKTLNHDFLEVIENTRYSSQNEEIWTQFSALVAPLSKWTDKGDIVCIIPYGLLNDLPFHALQIDGEPLIKRNPIFFNSSLTSWYYQDSGSKKSKTAAQYVVFGDPEQNLPQSVLEAENVAGLLNTTKKIGREVIKEELLKSLRSSSIVHFAGHGSFNQDSLGLQSSTIDLSGNVRITAEEIMNQQSKSDLVILSACDTGRHINHSEEERAGLVSALMASGVKSVIASLWPVIDNDARLFFERFYPKLLNGAPQVIAVQETMIELMTELPNFYRWGAFGLYGKHS